VIGVTLVAFTIAGRKLQEHGSDGLTRLGAFLWLLTPPLIGVWTTGYTSIFRPLVSTIEPLAPPLVWALLAAYFHDRRPSAIQHLWCFGGVFVIIVVLTPPTGSVTAWASPSLVALGVTWLVQTLRQRLRPAWLGYALGGCALALGLLMLLAMVTVPTGR
jgi:hypothetical protein